MQNSGWKFFFLNVMNQNKIKTKTKTKNICNTIATNTKIRKNKITKINKTTIKKKS